MLPTIECRCGFDRNRAEETCGTFLHDRKLDNTVFSHNVGCPALIPDVWDYVNKHTIAIVGINFSAEALKTSIAAAKEVMDSAKSLKDITKTCQICLDHFISPYYCNVCPSCSISLPSTFTWTHDNRDFSVPHVIDQLSPCPTGVSSVDNTYDEGIEKDIMELLHRAIKHGLFFHLVHGTSMYQSLFAQVGVMAAENSLRCQKCKKLKARIIVYNCRNIPAKPEELYTASKGMDTENRKVGTIISYWPADDLCITCGGVPQIYAQDPDGDCGIAEISAPDERTLLKSASAIAKSFVFAPKKPKKILALEGTCDVCNAPLVQVLTFKRGTTMKDSFCPVHAKGRAYGPNVLLTIRKSASETVFLAKAMAESLATSIAPRARTRPIVSVETLSACHSELGESNFAKQQTYSH